MSADSASTVDQAVRRVAHAFATKALEAYQLPRDATLRLISLSENATFLVETDRPLAILRVYRQDAQSREAVMSELAWIEAIRDAGVLKTPALLRTTDGSNLQWITVAEVTRACTAFAYVAGEAPQPDDKRVYELVGRTCAELHLHAQQWARPTWFTRTTWDLESILGKHAPWGRWQDGPGLDDAGRALLQQADQRVRRQLAAYPQTASNAGLVHCDFRCANLMLDANQDVWIIDFDDSGFSWYLWDLCSSTTFEEHLPHVNDIINSWLAGYRQVRTLSAWDLEAVRDLVFLRRLHVLAWLGSHSESDLARDLGNSYTENTYVIAEEYLQGRFLRDIAL